MPGYLKVTIQFRNGQKRNMETTIQPSVTDGCVFIKNRGQNSGGSFFPLDHVQSVDITPQEGFDADGMQRETEEQKALRELGSLKKK